MRFWDSQARSNTVWITVGECNRHTNMGVALRQDIKHVRRRIHSDVLANVAHLCSMRLFCPDSLHACVCLCAFKIECPCLYDATNWRWKGIHTRGGDYADGGGGGGLVKAKECVLKNFWLKNVWRVPSSSFGDRRLTATN
jgi:hypothetical protein